MLTICSQDTFDFRPHAGEAGDPDHLGATYLAANAISHGMYARELVVLGVVASVCCFLLCQLSSFGT